MTVMIVINYKKSDLTVRLCQSLARLKSTTAPRILIVDNGSTDESQKTLAEIKTLPLAVDFLFEKENWGYFGGARQGLSHIRKMGWSPEWVIVSNSDIEFTDPEFFEKLNGLSGDHRVGVVAPRILSGLSGRSQNPYMEVRPSVYRMQFYKWVFRFPVTCYPYQMAGLIKSALKGLLTRNKELESSPDMEPRRIYAAHGSFMIFSQYYFEGGGAFEHGPFLFGEEVTVAENCRRLGLQVRYFPALTVSHVEHASMGLFPSSRMLAWQKEASAYCADTYFSRRSEG